MSDHGDIPRRGAGFSVWLKAGRWYAGWRRAPEHPLFSQQPRPQFALGLPEGTHESQVDEEAVKYVLRDRALLEGIPKTKPVTLIDRYLDSLATKASGTRDANAVYAAQFRAFFGDECSPLSLRKEQIIAWRDHLLTKHKLRRRTGERTEGLAPDSVRNRMHWLASVCRFGGRPNVLKGIVIPGMPPEERVRNFRCFTADEMQRVIDDAKRNDPAFLNALVFFAFTGCRSGELRSIRVESLDEARHTVWIIGKNQSDRLLTLTGPMGPAWDALIRQRDTVSEYRPYLFSQCSSWANYHLYTICERLGIKRRSVHKIRHSFVSIMAQDPERAWNVFAVAKWIGHKSIHTTFSVYGHLLPEAPPSGPGFKV